MDSERFYRLGAFPDTHARMSRYNQEALPLACAAVADLDLDDGREAITHLIVVSCTGFVAPGLDFQLAQVLGLAPSVERTVVGFMGCSAALPGLKLAYHAVRSNPRARILLVALELCTLHLQESKSLDELLSFLLFGDGCAAALVTAEAQGAGIVGFSALPLPGTSELLTWRIGSLGFEMHLSGKVPSTICRNLPPALPALLADVGKSDVALWAVHPGGRTVLDAALKALEIENEALAYSRDVLRDFGNMSSAGVLFVLAKMIASRTRGMGCAMAFGPGITVEAMRFLMQ